MFIIDLALVAIIFSWDLLAKNYEAVIAISALALTILEAKTTRHHNRLSVKPSLGVFVKVNLIENKKDGQPIYFSLILANKGLGPAILEKIDFSINGENLLKNDEDLLLAMRRICQEIEDKREETFACEHQIKLLGKDIVVHSNEEIEAVKITCTAYSQNILDDLGSFFKNIAIKGEYKSFYGEKFTFNRNWK